MSATIERPTFFLGQYLGPDDLETTVQYHRGQLARHERGLHTPGIAEGLTLTLESNGVLTLSAGIAIDAQGREIVIAEAEQIEPIVFIEANVFIKDAWHPLFLEAAEEDPPAAPFGAGVCDVALPKRKLEGYRLYFGAPGEEANASGRLPEPGEGAEPQTTGATWPIVIGFVQWDDTKKQYSEVAAASGSARAQYAGARADQVVARGGKLELRAKSVAAQGQAVVEIDELDAEAGPVLRFGLQGEAAVKALFEVNKNGDVWAAGSLKSPLSLHIESGVITDGMALPLPPGVTDADLESGKVKLHALLSPRTPLDDGGFGAGSRVPVAHRCELNGRIVTCQVRWISTTSGTADEIRPGSCDYLVATYGPAEDGE
jgi:hypothetical protein